MRTIAPMIASSPESPISIILFRPAFSRFCPVFHTQRASFLPCGDACLFRSIEGAYQRRTRPPASAESPETIRIATPYQVTKNSGLSCTQKSE
jgi:hypothetical protein